MNTQSFAAEDLVSFCFERSTNSAEAQKSLSFLLLPKETTFSRPKDNCFDVATSTDRSKLLEKFLRKRYTLIAEEDSGGTLAPRDLTSEHCQIELKTTKKKTVNVTDVRVGVLNNASTGVRDTTESTTASLVLGLGKAGSLDLEGRALYIECTGGVSGIYQLNFFYSEQYKTQVSSTVSLKRNEPLNIGQITNDLNDKNKTLGLPESTYLETKGQEVINYELQIK